MKEYLHIVFVLFFECEHSIRSCLKCEISSTQRNSIDLTKKVAIKSQNHVVKYLLLYRSLLMAEMKFSAENFCAEIIVH